MNQTIKEYKFTSGVCLQLAQGDITDEHVDAIVNAANRHLAHGAGVAGAILRKGGWVIQNESDRWVSTHGPVSHAEPAYTRAGNLPCRYVIHAVGPAWGEGDEDEKLGSAVRSSLRLANQLNLESVAIPALSTGIFGFPAGRAAKVILGAIQSYWVDVTGTSLKLIRIVLFDAVTLHAFVDAWEQDDHIAA